MSQYEELRQAAMRLQVAVSKVFMTGGNISGTDWEDLINSQANIAKITNPTISELDNIRDEFFPNYWSE